MAELIRIFEENPNEREIDKVVKVLKKGGLLLISGFFESDVEEMTAFAKGKGLRFESKLLKEFGTVASLSILAIFILCLLIIPILYSFLPYPKDRHLEHLNRKWIGYFVSWIERIVKQKRIAIYGISVLLLILSFIGIYQIRISGSLIEDMPKDAKFFFSNALTNT